VKTLLLMRHAKSSWDDPSQDDHDRPLNKRGLRDAPEMGELLVDQSLVPDSITCSTAVRAYETARIVAESCRSPAVLRATAELYHADLAAWQHVIRQLPPESERALCVGHNPGIEMLLSELTDESHHMATAALAVLELRIDDWADFAPSKPLQHWMLWRPKDLPDPAVEG
jgi:phosphohistidine phosphatase